MTNPLNNPLMRSAYFNVVASNTPLSVEEQQELSKVVVGRESQFYHSLNSSEARLKLIINVQLKQAFQHLYPQYNYFFSPQESAAIESVFLGQRSLEETAEFLFTSLSEIQRSFSSAREKFSYLQKIENKTNPYRSGVEAPSWYKEAQQMKSKEKGYFPLLEKYGHYLYPLEKQALTLYLETLWPRKVAEELFLPSKLAPKIISCAKDDLEFIVQCFKSFSQNKGETEDAQLSSFQKESSLEKKAAAENRYGLLLAKYGQLLTTLESKVIESHYVLRLTMSETAQKVGASFNHVHVISTRAKKKLCYLLEREPTGQPVSKKDPLWYQKAKNNSQLLIEKYSPLLEKYRTLLSPPEVQALELRYQSKLLEEIATTLNFSEGYVSSLISKAQEKLDFLVRREKRKIPPSEKDPFWYRTAKNYDVQQAEYYRQLLKEKGTEIFEGYREFLYLKYELGCSNREIAAKMNVPINNVRSHLSLARKKLLSKKEN